MTALLASAAITGVAAAAPAGSPGTAAPTASPIQHVVVIYMENHSFDNVFGYWCDDHPGRCPDGGMPASVTLSDGSVVTPGVMPDRVPQVDHSVASQLAAMNIQGGVPQMNGWQNINGGGCDAAAGYACIGGYEPQQIPNLTTAAENFAISDDTFSFADSPSWGGHLYAVAGTLDHFTGDNPVPAKGVTAYAGWGCDSDKVTPWINPQGVKVSEPSCVPDRALDGTGALPAGHGYGGAFRKTPVPQVPTIMDELGAAGLSWHIYGAASPAQNGWNWSTCPTFAECLYGGQASNLAPSSRFAADAQSGSLPAFSLVTPGGSTYASSCHNQYSMASCDNQIGADLQAVMQGPDWSSTAVFITFDDFGGFYDQVPPPATLNASGQQAGPRVPLVVVSPYAKPGYTDTTPASFASILAYTEQNFGLAPLSANDAGAYNFSNAFDYSQAPLKPVQMTKKALPPWARHLKITKAEADDPT